MNTNVVGLAIAKNGSGFLASKLYHSNALRWIHAKVGVYNPLKPQKLV